MKKLSILLTGFAFTVGFGQNDFKTTYSQLDNAVVTVAPDSSDEACTQEVLSNSLENGGLFGDQRLAVDVNVDSGMAFTISQIKPVLIGDFTYVDVIIYEDNGGLPGAEVLNITDIPVSDQVATGTNFGFTFYEATLEPETPIVLEGGATGAKYWMEIYSDAAGWESTTADLLGDFGLFNNANSGFEWTIPSEQNEYVYSIVGDCATMGVSDINASSLAVYPNPAKDVVNVSLKNAEVKSISVTNLSGQTVLTSKNANVNVAALPAGVYVVKVLDSKGATHTSKIVKK